MQKLYTASKLTKKKKTGPSGFYGNNDFYFDATKMYICRLGLPFNALNVSNV